MVPSERLSGWRLFWAAGVVLTSVKRRGVLHTISYGIAHGLLKLLALAWKGRQVLHWRLSKPVSEAEYVERERICNGCEALEHTDQGRYCKACGCPKWKWSELSVKNRLQGHRCPHGKHPGSVDLRPPEKPAEDDSGDSEGASEGEQDEDDQPTDGSPRRSLHPPTPATTAADGDSLVAEAPADAQNQRNPRDKERAEQPDYDQRPANTGQFRALSDVGSTAAKTPGTSRRRPSFAQFRLSPGLLLAYLRFDLFLLTAAFFCAAGRFGANRMFFRLA